MAICYMSPTDEKIKDCLLKDTLERNSLVFSFCKLLSYYKEATSIALDGIWGSGKTFFVKQCKLLLDACNSQSNMSADERDSICEAIEKKYSLNSLKEFSNYTVYYDAWEHDDNTDPLLSLLYCIAVETNTTDVFEQPPQPQKVIGNLVDNISKYKIVSLFKEASEDNPLSGIKAQESLKECIRNYLNELPFERGNRVNIIIDELDRCTPSFAIKLLERIKHYVNNECITFVFATNLHSLEKSIRHYYGDNIEATKYLDRFFDVRFLLPPIDENILLYQIDYGNISIGTTICRYIVKRFDFSLRETLRYARAYRHASNINDGERAVICWVKYLLPLALALELSDIDKFRAFMAGDGVEHLKVLLEVPNIQESLKIEFRDIQSKQSNSLEIDALQGLLEELYEAIFKNDFSRNIYVYVGGFLEVSIWTKKVIFLSMGMFINKTND